MLLALAGCGGSGGGSSTESGFATPRVAVGWAERTRVVEGPASAVSAVIALETIPSSEKDYAFIVNRHADPAAYVQEETGGRSIPTGDYLLRVNFHPKPEGQGYAVATAAVAVRLRGDGSLIRSDGTPIGNVKADGLIRGVSYSGPNQINVGERVQFDAFGYGEDFSTVVALTVGSAKFEIMSGADVLDVSPSGEMVGKKAGSALVRATVDGITSDPFTIVVLPGRKPDVKQVSLVATGLVFSPATNQLLTKLSAVAGNRVAVLDADTGDTVRTIQFNGNPDRLAVSADGKYVYATFSFSPLIERAVVATGQVDRSFNVTVPTLDGKLSTFDVSVDPTNADRIVAAVSNGIENRVAVFQGTEFVAVSEERLFQAPRVLFGPGDIVYGSEVGNSSEIYRWKVFPDHLAVLNKTGRDYNVREFELAGNYLFLSSGVFLDAQTLEWVRAVETSQFYNDLSPSAQRVLGARRGDSGNVTVAAIDATTSGIIAQSNIEGVSSNFNTEYVQALSDTRMAYLTSDRLLLVTFR